MDIFDRIAANRGPLGSHSHYAHGYFSFPKLEGEIQPRMTFRGKEVLTWSLNNYLGLANHPEVRRIDGHDFAQLEEAFSALPFSDTKPSVIICDTVRGRGLPSIEARADRWFCNFSAEEVTQLLEELHSQEATMLTSETLTVR